MEEQLARCLEGTLSPDSAIRTQAEAALLDLHNHRACGQALSNLVLASEAPSHLRQGAAVSLRKWVRERWSPLFDGYKGFGPDEKPVLPEDKPAVRQALLHALSLPGTDARKLRTAAAATLSTVASSDWPDDFPELLPTVESFLGKGQSAGALVDDAARDRAHGALVFLSDFWTSEMDERQILGGAKDMLPLIEAVLANADSYSPALRSRCVLIFRQLLSSLYMVKGTYPEASKQIADDVMPRWLEALQGLVDLDLASSLLSSTTSSDTKQGQLSLVNEAWRTLKVASRFRPQTKDRLSALLTRSIQSLQQLEQPFAHFYLSSEAEPLPTDNPDGDSHTSATLPSLVCSIIEFCSGALRGHTGSPKVLTTSANAPSEAMLALVASLVSFAQVTSDEEEEWSSDANAFVLASDEDGVEYGLRVACCDLVQDLLDTFLKAAIQSLSQAVHRASDPSSAKGWRAVEAALAVLGGVGAEVREVLESSPSTAGSLQLESIFQAAVLPNVQQPAHPLLTGRAYIFASQFATALPAQLAQQFVEAAVQALESDNIGSQEETLIIKLSAVRCIKNFYRSLSEQDLTPYTPRIIARLGPLLSQTTEETLVLVLETIQCVVGTTSSSHSATDAVAPETYAQIVQASLNVWRGHSNDYIMLSVVSDLLESLAAQRSPASSHTVLHTAQSILGPAIVAALAPQQPDDADLLESAVSLTEALLKGAHPESISAYQTVQHLVGPVIKALHDTEDRDVLQSGIGCLTHLVRKASGEVVAWRGADSSDSTTAVQHFLAIISRLLIVDSESGGLRVGELLIALLRKMPQEILPVLPDLLQAMIRRLATAKTATFAQSLILPFAFLMKDQCEVVLDLLQSCKVEVGEGAEAAEVSGLQILGSKWAENAETITGFWGQRISTLALTRLVGVWAQGGARASALDSVLVQGEAIPDTSDVIRTRSRAKANPTRYTSVSLPCKALKMVLSDWDHATRGPPGGIGGPSGFGDSGPMPDGGDEFATDDEDEEWDDDEVLGGSSSKRTEDDVFLSDLLNGGGAGLDGLLDGEDEDDEDEDLKDDEVYQMDMRSYLSSFLHEVSRNARAGELAQGLSASEQQKLRGILGH